MLLVCCEGLGGFPKAIEAAFPRSTVQTCIVHMSELGPVRRLGRPKAVRECPEADSFGATAEAALTAFQRRLDQRYPMIGKSWQSNWQRETTFLAFPRDPKAIYTTNAIESLNFQFRKIIKTRWHFPSDDAAFKLLYLALSRAQRNGSCRSELE